MAVTTEKESAASAPKKGRGLSFEEKRKRLGEYFLEKVKLMMTLVPYSKLIVFLEGLFSIKRFRKIGTKSYRNRYSIR